ncbi:MAG TPA: DUF4112 domain-containing protein [Saprospiraceae bacterium]|nr:DUF4112 domain-containing protein [Saprospiraceae bacterium]HMQ83942.1 DUF4112 domain-containing protein [Saprospiraceae bacterium]
MQTELEPAKEAELAWLNKATAFLDNRYRIPGTNIRFGADFIIGLIPYGGDIISLGLSGLLVIVMARKGASSMILGKMLGNIALDALVGTIPILGDIFDLSYRANVRNLNLLKAHYEEGKHGGSILPVVLAVILLLLLIIGIGLYFLWRILAFLFS